MPTYGERLKELRSAKQMTQSELSKASGVSLGTLRNHEQDLRSISSDDLFAYCRGLGTSCSKFEDCSRKKARTKNKRR